MRRLSLKKNDKRVGLASFVSRQKSGALWIEKKLTFPAMWEPSRLLYFINFSMTIRLFWVSLPSSFSRIHLPVPAWPSFKGVFYIASIFPPLFLSSMNLPTYLSASFCRHSRLLTLFLFATYLCLLVFHSFT
jgi:hypothetical protein